MVPIGFLIGAGFVPFDKEYIGVICITVAVSFMSVRSSGYLDNIQDIAARWGILQVVSLQKLILLFHGGQDHSHPFGMPLVLTFEYRNSNQWHSKGMAVGKDQQLADKFLLLWDIEFMRVQAFSFQRNASVHFFAFSCKKSALMLIDHCENSTAIVTVNFGQLYSWASIINAYGENIVFHLALHFFVSH